MLRANFFVLMSLIACATALATTPLRLPEDPTLSPDGKQVVFAWNGDLWSATAKRGIAKRLTSHPADDGAPVYSHDGEQIAFTSNRSGSRQVYVMPAAGGAPEQITHHTEGYRVHGWFPDGRSLLCTGMRDHHWRDATRILRVWVDGERGEEVLANAAAKTPSLSPDGKWVLFNREGRRWWRKGYRGAEAAQVWLLDLESGEFCELLHEETDCFWPTWAPDGESFYFAKGLDEGFDLWRAQLPDKESIKGHEAIEVEAERVLDVDTHSVVMPTVASAAHALAYRHGFDLYHWKPDEAGTPRKIKLRARAEVPLQDDTARRKLDRAAEVAFHPDGLEIAFIAGGDVWVMDTELREPVQVTDTPAHESSLVWDPDGESLWFVSSRGVDADIYKAERKDAGAYWWRSSDFTVSQVTENPPTESRLRFDPTGERLLYVRGNGQLWSREVESGEETKLIDGFDRPDFDVSPDGRWLAYSQEDDNFNSEIYLLPVDGSQPPFNVSRHPDNDTGPRFSNDGKVLAFTGRRFDDEVDIYYVYLEKGQDEESDRDRKLEDALQKFKKNRKQEEPKSKKSKAEDDDGGSDDDEEEASEDREADKDDEKADEPERIKIDFEGLPERLRRISQSNATERGLVWIGDSQRLAFQTSIKGRRGIYTIELPKELSPKLLTETTGGGATWSSEAKALFLNASGTPARVDPKGKTTRYGFSVVQEYSRSERFRQGFDVAWRTMRDRWYDPRLGGKNWGEIRRRYRDMAAEAIDADMLGTVVSMMLGELNGSHLGFYPNSEQGWRAPGNTDRTAHLGLRFDPSHQGPGLKVADILPNGPTDRVDVDIAPGDLVLSIDGKPVDPASDLTQALNGLSSRDIELHVKKPDAEEATDVSVRPISYSVARRLLYDKWLEDSRGRVEDLSDGKLGYLHIRGMDQPSFYEFERQLAASGAGKSGLIIDVRDNGGGWTTDLLLTAVTQPRHAITVPRDGGPGYPQDRRVFATWHKPLLVLCNQNSFSNAEIFSHAIKTLGRGKLVGVTTGGGVISTGSAQVTDVGRMRMPFRGWFVLGSGKDMELNGAVPDEIVWPKPGELPAGVDRQLQRGVELLLEEVADRPEGPTLRYATEDR